jgi:hypothetical protein
MTFITNMVLRPWAREEGVPHILTANQKALYCGRRYEPEAFAWVNVKLWSKPHNVEATKLPHDTCTTCRRIHDNTEGAAH